MIEPASVALIIGAFLSGSIPVGVIFARARGVDIQHEGSGNIGATNVARVIGKKLGALVLLLDAGKGALPVAAAMWLAQPAWAVSAAGLAAVLGHCFPPWLRFRGGKGVATALGVFLVLDPVATGVSVAVFIVAYAAFRVASLGSLLGAVVFPLVSWWRERPAEQLALSIAIVVLIIARHRDNLRRLRRGQEHEV